MQTVKHSCIESAVNVLSGIVISFIVFHFILAPGLGIEVTIYENLIVSLVLTVVSFLRSFLVRRAFNKLHKRQVEPQAPSGAVQESINVLPIEFYDLAKIFLHGAKKHGQDNWLSPNGSKSSHKDMHASAFRHVAQSYCGDTIDHDSGLDHALNGSARLLMIYTLRKRNIVHNEDIRDKLITKRGS